jgi:hypothetical protein
LAIASNNVLFVKIEGQGAGIPSIIFYLLLKGFLQTNQWEKDIYGKDPQLRPRCASNVGTTENMILGRPVAENRLKGMAVRKCSTPTWAPV